MSSKRTLALLLTGLLAGFFSPAQAQFTDRITGIQTGLAIKAPVNAVSNANLTLSGEQTVNGVVVTDGDRVLVKDQTDTTENGIYVVDTSAWARAADFDGNRDVADGTLVTVQKTTGANTFYQVDATDPVVIGTSSIAFLSVNDPNISYDITDNETGAGLTTDDINDAYPEGNVLRYGVVCDSSDDTAALANALAVGYQGVEVTAPASCTIITDAFTMSDGNSNVPPSIRFPNVTIKANAGTSGVLVTIENPHAAYENFSWTGPTVFDSNSITSSGLLIHGSQRAYYGPFRAINAVGGPQIRVEAEAGFGVFYNTFTGFIAGGTQAQGGDDDGFSIKTTDATNRIQSNVWINPRSSWNEGAGYDIDHCSDVFVGLEAEKNDGNGVDVDDSPSITFIGGYSEHNHQSFSGDDTTDGTDDVSFVTTANTNRFAIFGGNHIGDVDLTAIGSNPKVLTRESGGLSLTKEGMAFGGETLFDNAINLSPEDGGIRVDGANSLLWDESEDEWIVNDDIRIASGEKLAVSAGWLLAPTATTAELEDIADDVNTNDAKVEGTMYFNTTTNAPVWAVGGADGDVWVDATGSTAHTPI